MAKKYITALEAILLNLHNSSEYGTDQILNNYSQIVLQDFYTVKNLLIRHGPHSLTFYEKEQNEDSYTEEKKCIFGWHKDNCFHFWVNCPFYSFHGLFMNKLVIEQMAVFSFWSSSWAHCSRFGGLGGFFKCHQQLKWNMSVGFKVFLFLSCLRFPRRPSQRRGSSALPGLQLCCHGNARGGGQRGALSTPSTPCGTGKTTLCISLWL